MDPQTERQEYERFEKAVAVLERLSEEAAANDRLSAAYAALSGFLLTGASSEVRAAIETAALNCNRLMRAAQEAEGKKEAVLSERDAQEAILELQSACELVQATEIEQVFSRLRHDDGRLPKAEIRLIRKYRERFVPLLLQECLRDTEILEQWDSNNNLPASEAVSNLSFFCLYLVSELEIAEFVPVILRGLQLPGELPFDLYGDGIHELVARFLAQFFHNKIEVIDELILGANYNCYVRWAAASSYKFLVRDKIFTPEFAVERLDHLFEATKVKDDSGRPGLGHAYEVSSGIAETIAAIGGGGISALGDAHDHWKFVDQSIIAAKEFRNSVSTGEELGELDSLPQTRVKNTIAELGSWGAFDTEETPKPSLAPVEKPARKPAPTQFASQIPPRHIAPKTPAASQDRVPRNAPCPCGSGKKYKKCCMRS